VCKPDSYIFQYTLEKLGIEANETIFLDDREKNVIGAKALGIHAIHYENSIQAFASLNKYVLDE
jgi:HAD superfamily hydrolase (TIGR01509 family)